MMSTMGNLTTENENKRVSWNEVMRSEQFYNPDDAPNGVSINVGNNPMATNENVSFYSQFNQYFDALKD